MAAASACPIVMILGLLYSLVRSLLDLVVLCQKSDAALQVEVLALRQQLRVLERQVHRPRFRPADRLVLSALSRVLPRPAWRSFLVSPETLVRWHRGLVRRKWALYARRPRRGRPVQSAERDDRRPGARPLPRSRRPLARWIRARSGGLNRSRCPLVRSVRFNWLACLLPAGERVRFVNEEMGNLGDCERLWQQVRHLVGLALGTPRLGWMMRPRWPPEADLMDRLAHLLQAAPRATAVPLIALGVAAAVLVLLGPVILLPNREPFNRLMEFLELVLGRKEAGRREPQAVG